jgi:hypothetical protein
MQDCTKGSEIPNTPFHPLSPKAHIRPLIPTMYITNGPIKDKNFENIIYIYIHTHTHHSPLKTPNI